jgi:hypothetical protein
MCLIPKARRPIVGPILCRTQEFWELLPLLSSGRDVKLNAHLHLRLCGVKRQDFAYVFACTGLGLQRSVFCSTDTPVSIGINCGHQDCN